MGRVQGPAGCRTCSSRTSSRPRAWPTATPAAPAGPACCASCPVRASPTRSPASARRCSTASPVVAHRRRRGQRREVPAVPGPLARPASPCCKPVMQGRLPGRSTSSRFPAPSARRSRWPCPASRGRSRSSCRTTCSSRRTTSDVPPPAAPAPAVRRGRVRRSRSRCCRDRKRARRHLRRPGLHGLLGRSLAAVAEMLQAPVATSVSGKGVIPECHPLAVGWGYGPQRRRSPRRSSARTQHPLKTASTTLLAIGVKFSEVSTGYYGNPQPKHVIHVDANADNLGKRAARPTCAFTPTPASSSAGCSTCAD